MPLVSLPPCLLSSSASALPLVSLSAFSRRQACSGCPSPGWGRRSRSRRLPWLCHTQAGQVIHWSQWQPLLPRPRAAPICNACLEAFVQVCCKREDKIRTSIRRLCKAFQISPGWQAQGKKSAWGGLVNSSTLLPTSFQTRGNFPEHTTSKEGVFGWEI